MTNALMTENDVPGNGQKKESAAAHLNTILDGLQSDAGKERHRITLEKTNFKHN